MHVLGRIKWLSNWASVRTSTLYSPQNVTTQEWPSLLSLRNKKPRQAVWHLSRVGFTDKSLGQREDISVLKLNFLWPRVFLSQLKTQKMNNLYKKKIDKAKRGLSPTFIRSGIGENGERAFRWHSCGGFCAGRVAGQIGRALIVNWSKSKVQSATVPGVENRLPVTLQQVSPSGVLRTDLLHSLMPSSRSWCLVFVASWDATGVLPLSVRRRWWN